MKNYLSTHEEPPPKLAESQRPNKSPLLIYLWLLILGVGVSITIAAIAIISLTNTGRVEKDPTQQTTIPSQQETTPTGWLPTIALLGAGVASTVAIYKWRHNLPTLPKRGLSRRQQRRLIIKQGGTTATKTATKIPPLPVPEPLLKTQLRKPDLIADTPIVTVLPPEKAQFPSDLGGQSLAEMMDIRQHFSLSAILQDFKRPD